MEHCLQERIEQKMKFFVSREAILPFPIKNILIDLIEIACDSRLAIGRINGVRARLQSFNRESFRAYK